MSELDDSQRQPHEPSYFGVTRENVHAIRAFSGEGIMSIKKKLEAANGDPLLAIGLLKYEGCLVNFKTGDGSARFAGMARSWAARLQMVDGVISYKQELEISSPSH